MKFKATGQFETETLIDLMQRMSATLQDAGVERVANVSVYLSIVDRKGLQRSLTLDDSPIDQMIIDCSDLALPSSASRLALGAPEHRSHSGPSPKRRRTQ